MANNRELSQFASLITIDDSDRSIGINTSVGIATTNPQATLHVVGDTLVTGVSTFNTDVYITDQLFVGGIEISGGGSAIGTDITTRNLNVTGISTFSNGPVLIGSGTSTGTASQPLQVTGGAYVSGNLGIGTTNPLFNLHVGNTLSGLYTGTTSKSYGIPEGTQFVIQDTGNNQIDNKFVGMGFAIQGPGGATRSAYFGGITDASGQGLDLVIGRKSSNTTYNESIRIDGIGNVGIGTTNPTSRLQVQGDARVSGVVTATTFIGALTGIAASATKLETPRTFEITGDVVATAISFDGTGNVSLAATIQPNSVGLGTDTTGDYVRDITGTSNQITVTSGTGEGSTPTLSIPNQFTPPQDVTVTRDLQVNRNLNVNGNITIGGTSATLFTTELKIFDPDIVLGFRTDALGNDVSTDNTANHGGVALASTEGTPLVNLFIAGIETNPATYKKIMWFKSGTFTGLNTDAWLINYAVGIGSTQVPLGVRLAAGGMQVTDSTLSIPQLNVSGVSTISVNSSSDALRITQTGSGNALVVEDSTNPDATRFVILPDGKVGVGTTGLIQYSSGVNDTSTFGILAPTGNDSAFVLKGNNGSATDGSGQTLAILVGSTGSAGSGTNIVHYSHDTSGIGTRRNAIRFTDNQIRFEDNVSGSVDVTINSSGSGELLVGRTSSTGTSNQLLQVEGGAYVSGNLGIGITNPVATLDARGKTLLWNQSNVGYAATKGDMDTYAVLKLRGHATDSTNMQFAHIGNGNAMGIQVTNALNTANWDILLNPFGGNVGIGTTNPNQLLHLNSSSSNQVVINLQNSNTGGNAWLLQSSGGSSNIGQGHFSIYDSNAIQYRLIINSSGSVGIGTTNPLQKLHVLGNLLVAAGSSTGQHITQKAYELNSGTLSWEGSAGQLFSITNNLTSGSIFSVNDVSGIPSFDVNADGTVTLAPYADGNVGIATTRPTSRLHVIGNALITGIATVNSNFVVNGNTLFADATNNRVGIGTTNPQSALSFGPNSVISAATIDGSDNTRLSISGGGDATTTRGGFIDLSGNERSTDAGSVDINSGNVANSYVRIQGRSSTSDIRFWINASEAARFDSSGRLGIGTTNPTAALTIETAGTTTTGASQIYLNGATSNRIDFNVNGIAGPTFTTRSAGTKIVLYPGVAAASVDHAFGVDTNTLWSSVPTTAQQFKWYGGTTELAVLRGDGRLGIGTTNPQVKLEIASDNGSSSNTLRFTDLDTATATDQQVGKIEFFTNDTSAPGAGVKAYIGAFAEDTTPDVYLSFATHSGSGNSLPTERVRITSSGSVGIGTTNPLSTLGVSGSVQINQGAAYTSSVTTPLYISSLAEGYNPASIGTSRYYQYFPSGTVIELNPTSGISSTAALIDATVYGSGGATNVYFGAVAGTANNGPANFVVGRRTGTSSWSESLRINTSGNVGIGTTNPNGRLHVGAASTQSVVVTSTGSVSVGHTSPSFAVDVSGDARVQSTGKMRFGGTAGTTNFYIQYNSTANSLDFVAG